MANCGWGYRQKEYDSLVSLFGGSMAGASYLSANFSNNSSHGASQDPNTNCMGMLMYKKNYKKKVDDEQLGMGDDDIHYEFTQFIKLAASMHRLIDAPTNNHPGGLQSGGAGTTSDKILAWLDKNCPEPVLTMRYNVKYDNSGQTKTIRDLFGELNEFPSELNEPIANSNEATWYSGFTDAISNAYNNVSNNVSNLLQQTETDNSQYKLNIFNGIFLASLVQLNKPVNTREKVDPVLILTNISEDMRSMFGIEIDNDTLQFIIDIFIEKLQLRMYGSQMRKNKDILAINILPFINELNKNNDVKNNIANEIAKRIDDKLTSVNAQLASVNVQPVSVNAQPVSVNAQPASVGIQPDYTLVKDNKIVYNVYRSIFLNWKNLPGKAREFCRDQLHIWVKTGNASNDWELVDLERDDVPELNEDMVEKGMIRLNFAKARNDNKRTVFADTIPLVPIGIKIFYEKDGRIQHYESKNQDALQKLYIRIYNDNNSDYSNIILPDFNIDRIKFIKNFLLDTQPPIAPVTKVISMIDGEVFNRDANGRLFRILDNGDIEHVTIEQINEGTCLGSGLKPDNDGKCARVFALCIAKGDFDAMLECLSAKEFSNTDLFYVAQQELNLHPFAIPQIMKAFSIGTKQSDNLIVPEEYNDWQNRFVNRVTDYGNWKTEDFSQESLMLQNYVRGVIAFLEKNPAILNRNVRFSRENVPVQARPIDQVQTQLVDQEQQVHRIGRVRHPFTQTQPIVQAQPINNQQNANFTYGIKNEQLLKIINDPYNKTFGFVPLYETHVLSSAYNNMKDIASNYSNANIFENMVNTQNNLINNFNAAYGTFHRLAKLSIDKLEELNIKISPKLKETIDKLLETFTDSEKKSQEYYNMYSKFKIMIQYLKSKGISVMNAPSIDIENIRSDEEMLAWLTDNAKNLETDLIKAGNPDKMLEIIKELAPSIKAYYVKLVNITQGNANQQGNVINNQPMTANVNQQGSTLRNYPRPANNFAHDMFGMPAGFMPGNNPDEIPPFLRQ